MESPISRRTEIVLIIIILLLAGILRLSWPGLTEFKADEARLLALALEMAEGNGIARRGISSSVGFPNFPMSVWLYAIPVYLWSHVYSATIFTGLLNTLAVLGCYWFTRRYWGIIAALNATIMLAVSPWAIIYSRKIWAQNLLPLFVMLWGISAALTFVERRQRFIWFHLLALAIAVQIHLAAAALIPATLIFLIIFWRRMNWKYVLIGAGLALLTTVPFLIYLWQNWSQGDIVGMLASNTAVRVLDLDALRHTLLISLGTDIHSLAGPEAFADYLKLVPDITLIYWLWGVLILGGTAWLIWNIGRLKIRDWRTKQPTNLQSPGNQGLYTNLSRSQIEVGLILLLWLWLPPLFFTWRSTAVFPHYFIVTYPAQYIIAGAFFAWLISRFTPYVSRFTPHANRLTAVTGWTTLLLTAVAQLWLWGTLLNFLGQRATPGGFGTPLAMQLTAVEEARTALQTSSAAEVLIAGKGEAPDMSDFPAIYDTLLRDVPHRFVDVTQSALFPEMAAVVLLEPGVNQLAGLYEETAVNHTTIPLRQNEAPLYILTLPPAAAPTPDVTFEPSHLFANWVNLYGYDDLAITGETAVWQIYWGTGGNPDPVDYHFFNHLLDANEERIAQADGAAYSPAQWRAGDIVISRFDLPWPEGERPYMIRTGMYIYPSLESVPLLDVAGNPYTDAIEIPGIE